MAINGTNKKKLGAQAKVSGNDNFTQNPSQQPPAFRAKGRGFANKLPDFPATSNNANASVTNTATVRSNDEFYKLWLFVDRMSTGWAVAGETAQAHSSRTFYPRNLSQDELVIEGMMANQFEYDKLVQFVQHHQNTILSATDYVGDDFQAVDFALFKPTNPRTFDHFRPVKYKVAIVNIAAGHERFVQAPAFTLRCKVLFDYMDRFTDTSQAIDRKINYHEVFGQYDNPDPIIGETAEESKATTVKNKPKPATNMDSRK